MGADLLLRLPTFSLLNLLDLYLLLFNNFLFLSVLLLLPLLLNEFTLVFLYLGHALIVVFVVETTECRRTLYTRKAPSVSAD